MKVHFLKSVSLGQGIAGQCSSGGQQLSFFSPELINVFGKCLIHDLKAGTLYQNINKKVQKSNGGV
jgi:hypothetical protein